MAWRILVTGATGIVGREIVRRLHQREVEFVAACRQEGTFPEEIKNLSLDYGNPAILEQAFRDVDVLFLLIPFADSMQEWAENAIGAARRAGVKLIVRTSALGADVGSPYLWLRTEGQINRILNDSGIPSIVVKTNSFMQNYKRLYGEALQQGALYLPEGEGRTSFVDVGDLANIVSEILVNPFQHLGREYTITGGRALSNAEALSIISMRSARRISYVPVTEEITRNALKKIGASSWWIEFVLSRHRSVRDGEGEEVTSTFQEMTGLEPRTFEDYSEELAETLFKRPSGLDLH